MKKSQLATKIFARIFSDSGLHVCDTEPGELEKICFFIDAVNRIQKHKMRCVTMDGVLHVLNENGLLIAKCRVIADRDLMIFLRDAINNGCRGIRAVSQVQGGMRFDAHK